MIEIKNYTKQVHLHRKLIVTLWPYIIFSYRKILPISTICFCWIQSCVFIHYCDNNIWKFLTALFFLRIFWFQNFKHIHWLSCDKFASISWPLHLLFWLLIFFKVTVYLQYLKILYIQVWYQDIHTLRLTGNFQHYYHATNIYKI